MWWDPGLHCLGGGGVNVVSNERLELPPDGPWAHHLAGMEACGRRVRAVASATAPLTRRREAIGINSNVSKALPGGLVCYIAMAGAGPG